MPLPGSAAPLGLLDFVEVVGSRLIAEGLAYDGLNPGGPIEADTFSLWYGVEDRDRWTGADSVVLELESGALGQKRDGGDLQTFHTMHNARPVVTSLLWGITIRVWGSERALIDSEAAGRFRRLLKRRRAYQIFENVYRVFYLAAQGYIQLVDFSGWQNETPIQRYGEEIIAGVVVSVPIYDYVQPAIPIPQRLVPGAGQPAIG